MLKKIVYTLLTTLCMISLLSCEGDDVLGGNNNNNGTVGKGTIYGVITDYATGEPIANANVQLRPTGETTLTGYDGRFEFIDMAEGDYSLIVSKAEYTDLIDDYVISVRSGLRLRRDVQIKKVPTYIRITDMKGNDISSLDFSSEASTNVLSFNIYNNGTVKINCNFTYSCDWITFISPTSCTIVPGNNAMITIQIDRSKLKADLNTTFLYVSSNNGSNMLLVSAIGEEILPNVVTLPVTYVNGEITPWCNTFHAQVTIEGNPAYYKRGFCFSATNSMPTINDNKIEIQGTGLGEYSYTHRTFPSNTQKYYVRSWLMYGSGNIIYGNVVSFVYNDL